MPETATEVPAPSYPETLEQANRWIDQLRAAYHREHAYAERLAHELHQQRNVVDFARWWYKARGMHKAPWLGRLKTAVRELEEKLAHA